MKVTGAEARVIDAGDAQELRITLPASTEQTITASLRW